MNHMEQAVEAATDLTYRGKQLTEAHARALLTVAAPHIRADVIHCLISLLDDSDQSMSVALWLRSALDNWPTTRPNGMKR